MRFATTFEYRQWYLGGKAKTDAVTDFHDLYLRNLRDPQKSARDSQQLREMIASGGKNDKTLSKGTGS